jgi:outer membrane biogenesis lipoprotein LolB
MMLRLFKGALLLVLAVLLLSACSANVKEEQNATNDKVETAFNSAPKSAKNKNEDIHFYMPFGFEIKEEKQNNILLKNGSKTYILFYNQQEGPDSEVVYNATLNANKYDFKKKYKKDGKLGFLLIRDLGEKKQEVTVGIGGVKMTTETKTSSMKADAETMMQIVKSVKKIKQEDKK